MNKLLSLLADLEWLSVTTTKRLAFPLTVEQLDRIASLTSADELNDQDFEWIDQNLTAAKAYGYKIAELEKLIPEVDYIEIYQASQRKEAAAKPPLANVIELFPKVKLLSPRTRLPLAASTDDSEPETGIRKPYTITTSTHHEVYLHFEHHAHPVSQRVTAKLHVSVPGPLPDDVTIAWLLPQSGDDAIVQPILQCQLKVGQTEAVAIRRFEPNEWAALPPSHQFGEVGNSDV